MGSRWRLVKILKRIWFAAANGNLDAVQRLSSSANEQTPKTSDDPSLTELKDGGWTALMFAAANGRTDVVEYLLSLPNIIIQRPTGSAYIYGAYENIGELINSKSEELREEEKQRRSY